MKLYHLSSGSIGDWHFKAGRDNREWPPDKAQTLIATGASRPATAAPPPPTPAPSGRELRHAVARAMEKELAEDRTADREALGISGDGDDDDTPPPVNQQQLGLSTSNASSLVPGGKAEKAKGPRAQNKVG